MEKCWGRKIMGSDGRERWKWSGREEREAMGGEQGSGGEGRGGEVMGGEERSDG